MSFASIVPSYISYSYSLFFFFNDPATTEIYTLSLHDALPIWPRLQIAPTDRQQTDPQTDCRRRPPRPREDRKSTRLNSSHRTISYAVFCLKKKKKNNIQNTI